MTERTGTFHREAYRAAGPVFLVTLGIVCLMIFVVLLSVGALPDAFGTILAAVGVISFVAGLLWGGIDSAADRRRRRQAS
ncbi:MAG TPA: hypothetical protein VNZ52_06380 [Candidatus Thermoplasmatota archaeon]|nr:hypothetical protein [Candidatus Thermoplasmatota archaeon]